mmetsp:Transcript_31530/g.61741  ORF Transcript_31530/g.61741 Transcript_31530/m.61741 type:complete len:163 (-) Transcript_31530:1191-1679(-)
MPRSRSRGRDRRDRGRRRDYRRRSDSRDRGRFRRSRRSPEFRRERRESPVSDGSDVETLTMTDDDIAFVLGRGGMTKRKIARVAKAKLDVYERDLKIDIHGPRSARKRAKEYIKLVMAQRVGPVYMDVETKREDLTVVSVPSDCIGQILSSSHVITLSNHET